MAAWISNRQYRHVAWWRHWALVLGTVLRPTSYKISHEFVPKSRFLKRIKKYDICFTLSMYEIVLKYFIQGCHLMKKVMAFIVKHSKIGALPLSLSYLGLITSLSSISIHAFEYLENVVNGLIEWNWVIVLKEGKENNEYHHQIGHFKSH